MVRNMRLALYIGTMSYFPKILLVTVVFSVVGPFWVEGSSVLSKLLKLGNVLEVDPDTGLNLYEFIENHGYDYVNYTVITDDGYILRTVRISCPKNKSCNKNETKPAVLLLHGIWSNPEDLIFSGDTSIGFLLVENGFDVFLMASRGNTYSTNHIKLKTNSREYWNFSWHEVGYYDIPANMDLIKKETSNENISFIGHSQGGTAFLAMAATRPEYAKRITVSHLFAPVVYMTNTRLPIKLLIKNVYVIEEIVRDLNLDSQGLFTYSPIIELLAVLFCSKNSPTLPICVQLLGLAGPDPAQLNATRITVMGSNDPAGGSFKEVFHYFQVTKNKMFRQYDYLLGNYEQYNQKEPPSYDLGSVTLPVFVWYGKNDYFCGVEDFRRVIRELGNATDKLVPYPAWNHIDFAFAIEGKRYVYDDVIKDIKKRTNNTY